MKVPPSAHPPIPTAPTESTSDETREQGGTRSEIVREEKDVSLGAPSQDPDGFRDRPSTADRKDRARLSIDGRARDLRRQRGHKGSRSAPIGEDESDLKPEGHDEDLGLDDEHDSTFVRQRRSRGGTWGPPNIAEAIYAADDAPRPRAHLFRANQEREPGDLSLLEPNDAQAEFGSPLAYARHAIVLAAMFRQSTGATRDEAIEYLARMFVALEDRVFARKALKAFGPDTGIIDLYPLEVVEHILENYPGFLPKIGFGRILFADEPGDERPYRLKAGHSSVLHHHVHLKLRGFAVRGGGRPGYEFAPLVAAGQISLTMHRSGPYVLLVSGATRSGHTIIDRLSIVVDGAPMKREDPMEERDRGRAREEGVLVERDEAAVNAWPRPPKPELDALELLQELLGESRRARALSLELRMTSPHRTEREDIDGSEKPRGGQPLVEEGTPDRDLVAAAEVAPVEERHVVEEARPDPSVHFMDESTSSRSALNADDGGRGDKVSPVETSSSSADSRMVEDESSPLSRSDEEWLKLAVDQSTRASDLRSADDDTAKTTPSTPAVGASSDEDTEVGVVRHDPVEIADPSDPTDPTDATS